MRSNSAGAFPRRSISAARHRRRAASQYNSDDQGHDQPQQVKKIDCQTAQERSIIIQTSALVDLHRFPQFSLARWGFCESTRCVVYIHTVMGHFTVELLEKITVIATTCATRGAPRARERTYVSGARSPAGCLSCYRPAFCRACCPQFLRRGLLGTRWPRVTIH
jgi:hypothetical protein